jgi:hypothetical protein
VPAVPLLWMLLTACAPSPTAPLGPTEPNPSDTVPADDTPAAADPRAPTAATLRRLTSTEHRNLLLDLLGAPLPPTPVAPDTDPYLFPRIGATTDAYSDLALQQLDTAARTAAAAVFDDPARREALVGCAPAAVAGDACVNSYLAAFGRRAWRRPLTADELASAEGVVIDAALGDVWEGLQAATAAILQAPSFVYHVSVGTPDPAVPGLARATGYEVADRLASLLWASGPDDALLDAAAAGRLDTAAGVAAEARRLLDQPRARDAVLDFFVHWLALDEVPAITRDAYPGFSPAVASAMATESLLVVDDLVWRRDADVRQLLTTRRTFLNAPLAAYYGVDAPGASEVAFAPVKLPDDGPRAGVLTFGAFLTTFAHQTQTSPTLRGKFVRERLLCGTVPPPPPGVSTDLPVDQTAATLRERLEAHRANPACSGCHAAMDPPGLTFEGFDAAGAYRTTENGAPIDTRGELDGVTLADPIALGEALAVDDRVPRCVVRQVFRHAHGRVDNVDDRPAIDALEAAFIEGGHRFRPLLLALVTDESFRTFAVPASAEESP